GQLDAERRPAPRGLGDLDRALVTLDDRRDDRESEPGAAGLAGARGVGAPEPLEDPVADLRWDALAVVDDRDRGDPARLIDLYGQFDRAAFRGEPDRIGDEVGHDLADFVL